MLGNVALERLLAALERLFPRAEGEVAGLRAS
jgi:hypothetical protein